MGMGQVEERTEAKGRKDRGGGRREGEENEKGPRHCNEAAKNAKKEEQEDRERASQQRKGEGAPEGQEKGAPRRALPQR